MDYVYADILLFTKCTPSRFQCDYRQRGIVQLKNLPIHVNIKCLKSKVVLSFVELLCNATLKVFFNMYLVVYHMAVFYYLLYS